MAVKNNSQTVRHYEPGEGLRGLLRSPQEAFLRFLLLGGIWYSLTTFDVRDLPLALSVIFLALLASFKVLPRRTFRLRLRGFLNFVPFFLWQSWLGGWDVAWRALHPKMPLNPGIIKYRTRLPPGLPRVFLVWTVSLLPGTACLHLESNLLTIHALNTTDDLERSTRLLEMQISKLFVSSPGPGVKVLPTPAP